MAKTESVEAFLPLLLNKRQVAWLLSTSIWGVEELMRRGKLVGYSSDEKTTKFKTADLLKYVASLTERE